MSDQKRRKPTKPRKQDEVVLLEDLAPRKEVTGGATAKLRFGEPPAPRLSRGRVDDPG